MRMLKSLPSRVEPETKANIPLIAHLYIKYREKAIYDSAFVGYEELSRSRRVLSVVTDCTKIT